MYRFKKNMGVFLKTTIEYIKAMSYPDEEISTVEDAYQIIDKSSLLPEMKEQLKKVLKIVEAQEKAMEKGIYDPTIGGIDYLIKKDGLEKDLTKAGKDFKESLKNKSDGLKVKLEEKTAGKKMQKEIESK